MVPSAALFSRGEGTWRGGAGIMMSELDSRKTSPSKGQRATTARVLVKTDLKDLKDRRVCWELGEARVDRETLEEVDSKRPSEFELANSWRAENEVDEESDVRRRGMGAGGDARSLMSYGSSIWNEGTEESNMLGDRADSTRKTLSSLITSFVRQRMRAESFRWL